MSRLTLKAKYVTKCYCKHCGMYLEHDKVEYSYKNRNGKIIISTLERPLCPECHNRLRVIPRKRKSKEKYI